MLLGTVSSQLADEYKAISLLDNPFEEESMLTWCALLFALGIAAFLDSIYNYGNIFRQINSVLFMLTSLGLLVRTTTKMKLKTFETQLKQIEQLQAELREIKTQKKVSV